MKELSDYIKGSRQYVSLSDGESFVGTYKGYSIGPDRFNPGKETVSYLFQPLGSSSALPWTKSSARIAAQMNKFSPGEVLKITRMGEGTETRYKIIRVNESQEVPF